VESSLRFSEKPVDMKVLVVSGHGEKIVLSHKILDVHIHSIEEPFPLRSLERKTREVRASSVAAAGAAGDQIQLG
jgi:hypothetical protein